jgi:hypothetical protein
MWFAVNVFLEGANVADIVGPFPTEAAAKAWVAWRVTMNDVRDFDIVKAWAP